MHEQRDNVGEMNRASPVATGRGPVEKPERKNTHAGRFSTAMHREDGGVRSRMNRRAEWTSTQREKALNNARAGMNETAL